MTQPSAENATKVSSDEIADGKTASRKTAETGAAMLSDARDNAENFAEKSTAALRDSGRSMLGGFQQLADAYQQIASRNSERLTESLRELGAVKSPVDFIQLQQKLLKETFENAFADSKQVGEITLSVFTTAFDPMKKNLAAVQQAAPQAARSYR